MGEDWPCEINRNAAGSSKARGGLGSLKLGLNCWKRILLVDIDVESESIDADFIRDERPAEFIVP